MSSSTQSSFIDMSGLSCDLMAALITTMHAAHQKHALAASHNKASIIQSFHARHRANLLGLSISVEAARSCPQSAVSLVPLPVIEVQTPPIAEKQTRPVLPRLVISPVMNKPLPPLPHGVPDGYEPADEEVPAEWYPITDVSVARSTPRLELFDWVFEEVPLQSTLESASGLFAFWKLDGAQDDTSTSDSDSPATPGDSSYAENLQPLSPIMRKRKEASEEVDERPCKMPRQSWHFMTN